VDRSELLERYRALPLPTTKDEPWRFTDLRGFDPDAYAATGEGADLERMLDIAVSGLATVTENGIEVERAPEGVTFERLDETNPRLHQLVGWDEKFAAHTQRCGRTACSSSSRAVLCSRSRCM
jgi:hypothetical protein